MTRRAIAANTYPLTGISARNAGEMRAPNTRSAANFNNSVTSSPNSWKESRISGLIVATVIPAAKAARNSLTWVSDAMPSTNSPMANAFSGS